MYQYFRIRQDVAASNSDSLQVDSYCHVMLILDDGYPEIMNAFQPANQKETQIDGRQIKR
jgi:hypothetical protein